MKNAGPAFKKTLNGITVTVWANFPSSAPNGKTSPNTRTYARPRFSIEFSRTYKDGDMWRVTKTFNGLGDLAVLRELADWARDFIRSREEEHDAAAADEGRDDAGMPMREKTKKPAPAATENQPTVNDTDSPQTPVG